MCHTSMHLADRYYLLKFTVRLNNRGDPHQNPINLPHARKEGLLASIAANISSGHRLNCGFWPRAKAFLYSPSARGHSFKRALPYHIKVEILLHPVGGAVKLFNHFHDVECVQGVHYGGSLYAPCKRQKLKDQISGIQPLLSTFPARPLQLVRPLTNAQTWGGEDVIWTRLKFSQTPRSSLVGARSPLAARLDERRRRQLARGKGLWTLMKHQGSVAPPRW